MAQRHTRRPLSSAEDGAVGAVVGAMEVLIMQPAAYWKAELQQQRFTWRRALDPRHAYRGTAIAAGSIAPIVAIQFSANGVILRALQAYRQGKAPERAEKMLSGLLAGAASAVVMAPCMLIEINQQKHGGTMTATWSRILRERGPLGAFTGYSMNAAREGIFCCTYIAAAPSIKEWVQQRRPDLPGPTASAVSSVLAGTTGALLSHPSDTLMTRLQGGIFPTTPGERLVHTSLRASLADMHSRGGIPGVVSQCYAGVTPRIFRLVCCTFIYQSLREVLSPLAVEVGDSLQERSLRAGALQGALVQAVE